jgi:hypothetical protein
MRPQQKRRAIRCANVGLLSHSIEELKRLLLIWLPVGWKGMGRKHDQKKNGE